MAKHSTDSDVHGGIVGKTKQQGRVDIGAGQDQTERNQSHILAALVVLS